MSTTDNAPLTIRDMIEPAIKAAGGWVNTHAHADRAYTLSPDVLEMRRTCTLQQKWDALDRLKRESTEEDFYRRFSLFFENQIAQGVTALATFVDIDPQSEDRAIMAGLRAREHYQDQLTVKFANQTLKGVIHPEARKWFDIGADLVDIIGALPKRDERDYGKGAEAFDIILSTAKERNKMVHVHVDQFNESLEYETEQLCEKTIEHGMEGRVVAILLNDKTRASDVLGIMQALKKQGVHAKLLYSRMGEVTADDGSVLPVAATFAGAPSLTVDAVIVPCGDINSLLTNGDAVYYLLEAYKHLKPIALSGDARQFKAQLKVADQGEDGIVEGDNVNDAFMTKLFDLLAVHRVWSRSSKIDQIPA